MELKVFSLKTRKRHRNKNWLESRSLSSLSGTIAQLMVFFSNVVNVGYTNFRLDNLT